MSSAQTSVQSSKRLLSLDGDGDTSKTSKRIHAGLDESELDQTISHEVHEQEWIQKTIKETLENILVPRLIVREELIYTFTYTAYNWSAARKCCATFVAATSEDGNKKLIAGILHVVWTLLTGPARVSQMVVTITLLLLILLLLIMWRT